ncbi:CAP domain-containing protein [Streptomyces cinnamoneus]|uniref:CAP domain-containing protein n=1 Tax=Streptomyces cinnamoneus TaxID=53446 RepID=UPI001EFC62F5|nr:CAP domain-containing protein [Streptomyces cinnamoneus]
MGRHRRSARATADEAVSPARKAGAPPPDDPVGVFAAEDPAEAVTQPLPVVRTGPSGGGRHRSPHRARRARSAPGGRTAKAAAGKGKALRTLPPARRTGLLGASAAVAMSAVAMVSGLLPSGVFSTGGATPAPGLGGSGQVRADAPHQEPAQPARPTTAADRAERQEPRAARARAEQARAAGQETPVRQAVTVERGDVPASRSAERPPPGRPAPAASPSAVPSAGGTGVGADPGRDTPAPRPGRTPARQHSPAADEDDLRVRPALLATPTSATAHLVVALVNAERAKAGCRPLRADAKLARLAQSFSDDMARRGFFDHTDPDGKSPWERAATRGIKNLGGENIAHGHPDARTVMDAWMHSSGHRANILNCDYRSIGVGVHQSGDGPYWTQDFGY